MKQFFFIFTLILLSITYAYSDFQIWNADSVNIRFSNRTVFEISSEFRYRQTATKLYYKHYQGRLTFIRSPNFLITPGYRQLYLRQVNHWIKEYHPMLDLTLQVQGQNSWAISNRSRIVYRIFEKRPGLWRFRNRLEVICPIQLTEYGIKPYFADEFFWDESHGINQNRLAIGLKIPYHERTQLDLFYMLQALKNSLNSWKQQKIIGIYFSLYF